MIQLLIEPSYGANLWAQAYLAGIREEARKRGWELQTLTEEAEAAEEPVLLVGSAVGWLKSRLARLAARNLPCLIAGVPPQGVRCGFAAPDYEEAAAIFAARTPESRALFAVHPSSAADEVKREAFLRQCPEGKIYENSDNLIEAAQRLARDADKLDAVLCANDVAAMTLRRLLPGGGPRLYAFGEQALPREEEISLFRMDLFACGAQAVRLCRKLEKEPDIRRCVWVPCRLEAADEPGMADTLPADPASAEKPGRAAEAGRGISGGGKKHERDGFVKRPSRSWVISSNFHFQNSRSAWPGERRAGSRRLSFRRSRCPDAAARTPRGAAAPTGGGAPGWGQAPTEGRC